MTIELHPGRVRSGWQRATSAVGELEDARRQVPAAKGTDVGDLQPCLDSAGTAMDGVLRVAIAIVGEFGTNMEACIADFLATDGAAAGQFNSLDAGPGGQRTRTAPEVPHSGESYSAGGSTSHGPVTASGEASFNSTPDGVATVSLGGTVTVQGRTVGQTFSWTVDIGTLRTIISRLLAIDLWPPWDAAQTIVDTISDAVEILTREPEPHQDRVSDASAAWHRIDQRVSTAVTDLEAVPRSVTDDAWSGVTGDAFRTSVTRLGSRVDTVDDAAADVKRALDVLAGEMLAARQRHRDADNDLRGHLTISWGWLNPTELADRLRGIVYAAVKAVREAVAAYEDAETAIEKADRDIVAAMGRITLPDHLPTGGGIKVVDAVNAWNDDNGPLSGSVLERYDQKYGALSPQEQQAVTDALAGARTDRERALVMSAVASGLTGEALRRYLSRLSTMTPEQMAELNPLGHPGSSDNQGSGQYYQPDQTTCGSSSLVMSRMVNDPAYAMWMETGYDPRTGVQDPRTPEQRFADEALKMHQRTNDWTSANGGPQMAWPMGAGTAPWAVADEMSNGSGVPGTTYETRMLDPQDRGSTYDEIVRANEKGHTVPIYTGNQTRPGHVMLVTASGDGGITIYEPSTGNNYHVSREDFVNGNVNVAGWDEPWAAVVPED